MKFWGAVCLETRMHDSAGGCLGNPHQRCGRTSTLPNPLLSNIYLDKLDKELERRGHVYVRFADDVRTDREYEYRPKGLRTWTDVRMSN